MTTPDVLRQLSDLQPAVRQRRAEIEDARQLPRDLAAALRRSQVFRLGLPKTVGGLQATPQEILQAIETVAAADGSTGWCAMVGVANNIAAGYMHESGARAVFADPDVPTAGIAAPAGAATRVDGGVQVSGRWPFASGVTDADWLWAGCMVMQDGKPHMTPHGPEIIHVCVPMSAVAVHDTWRVSGLNGTGSNDVSVAGAFVPDDRIFNLFFPQGHCRDALYRMPSLGWFVSQVGAVSLGIARAALDELVELAQTKIPTLSMAVLADRPAAQIAVAEAEASLAAARAFLYASVDDHWQTLIAGDSLSPRQIAINRLAALNATAAAAAVARTAATLAGGGAIYTSSSMQRHVRDTEAITHHFTVAPHVWEDAGRVFMGRQPTAPIF